MPKGDRYDLEAKEEPTCLIDVHLRAPEDSRRFLDTLDRFATKHGLIAAVSPLSKDGRVLPPTYESSDLIISPLIIDYPQIPPANWHAQARLHAIRRSYTWEEFLAAAEAFRSAFEAEFGDQIIEWEEPNRGE